MLKMAMKNIFLIFLILHVVLANTKHEEPYTQCVILQERETIYVPFDIPYFLKTNNKTQCQVQEKGDLNFYGLFQGPVNIHNSCRAFGSGTDTTCFNNLDQKMLRCGETSVYVRPECVCSFYNVFDATLYHMYSSCPKGAESDIVTQLKCADCQKYSLKSNGPCINGGKLMCKGEEVAPDVTCQCPPNFGGGFCENKIENITRICDRISMFASFGLEDCDNTEMECVTYSRNKQYAYRCRSDTSQKRLDLPLCLDTESPKPSPADENETEGHPASGAPTQFLPIFGIVLGGIVFQICTFL